MGEASVDCGKLQLQKALKTIYELQIFKVSVFTLKGRNSKKFPMKVEHFNAGKQQGYVDKIREEKKKIN